MTNLTNDPTRKSELAAEKHLFIKNSCYAVVPIHTRFGALAWFVWDEETPDTITDRDSIMGREPAR